MALIQAVFPAVRWTIIGLLFAVIQMAYSQASPQQNYLPGSSDTFVDPFGSVLLQCQVNPNDLQARNSVMLQWKRKVTGGREEKTSLSLNTQLDSSVWEKPYSEQDGVFRLLGDKQTGTFNLQITNVTYDQHDGDYWCDMNVPAGSGSPSKVLRSQEFHLYVKYQPQAPQVEFSTPADDLREGQKVTITCSSRDGNPPPEIKWMRDGIVVPSVYTPAKSRADVTKADLVLDLTKEHNKAVYTCAVSNPALPQPLVKTLDPLNVKYKPRIKVSAYVGPMARLIAEPATSVAVEAGTEILLTCDIDANPPAATPSWRRNSQVIQPNSYNFTFLPGMLTKESKGGYSCVAANGVENEQSGEIQLDVLFAPVVTLVPAVASVKEGENGNIWCQVESNPPVTTVEWYDPAGNRVGTSDPMLTFSAVQRRQAGLYECRAKVHFQTYLASGIGQVFREGRGTGRVEVQYRPGVATIEPENPKAAIGSRVSLRCSAADPGVPAARFKWRKLDGLNGADRSSTGEYFNITEARLDDNGDYECTPTNDVGDGPAKVVRLEVSEPVSWITPRPYTDNTIIRKISDGPLSLFCEARGRPAPIFKWFKDGEEIQTNDRLYKITSQEPKTIDRYAFVTRSELKFQGPARTELFSSNETLQRTDRGRYMCKAVNDAGQPITHDSQVRIQYPPEFRNRYSKVATDLGQSISTKIECLVESHPPATISWTRNGQPIFSRPRIVPTETMAEEMFKSVLIVDSPSEADLGDYRCSATNLIGDVSKNLSLVRRSVPDDPRNLKQKDLSYDGVTLTWEPGFDGGYAQKFTVVMTRPDGAVKYYPVNAANMSEFRVADLTPLNRYNFRLKAENQLGPSRGSDENLDIMTPQKPILSEDIPRPNFLRYDPNTGVVSYGVRPLEKPLNLCAMIDVQKANQPWSPVARCIPFSDLQGTYTIPGPSVADFHPRVRFCLYEKQDVCSEPVDENSVVQASTLPNAHLDIILPVVIIGALLLIVCMVTCILCKRRAKKVPVKMAKTSNMTLTSSGSLQNGNAGGYYGDGYANKALDNGAVNFTIPNGGAKMGLYGTEPHYGNGALYAQVDKKLNGDTLDGTQFKPPITDIHGNLYSDSPLYLQSYPYDEGYGHQHSPMDPNYTHVPGDQVSGLPDPYEEYEKTPSFGEESVESGYSTSNSRGRRVIREIIV
ncbi:hemicentin-1-like isoform X2 [Paramacrobiotus metropolitanus]|uniref:hemicentin-1-like isoform X2 n=1 Tax=Paramacrobiotus metropolitanus TaxID=2943436 RepID=UPI002445F824|nr:hemicentin-1-like isoform X2 [Paramacrobiotus metropolitanus]XP_055338964.1 hemicentin-1-like isoform X2 [Paramacrobiotus metropolitanus]